MIAKITYGSDVVGCAEYDINKGKDARVILANGLPLTTDIWQIQTLFNIQASLSSRVEKPVMHIALSFSLSDGPRLENSPQMVRNIIESYLERMGLAEAQYIVTQHRNTAHPHYHILVNRVFADGHVYKTGFERNRSVKACRAITQSYGLTMGQGRSNVNANALKEPDRSRQILYREISYALARCNSFQEFRWILESRGVVMLPTGRDGKAVGYSFKRYDTCWMSGSKISRQFSKARLTQTIHEKERAPKEMPVLIIPEYPESHKESHVEGVSTAIQHAPDAPSLERDIRRREEEKKRKKRGIRM